MRPLSARLRKRRPFTPTESRQGPGKSVTCRPAPASELTGGTRLIAVWFLPDTDRYHNRPDARAFSLRLVKHDVLNRLYNRIKIPSYPCLLQFCLDISYESVLFPCQPEPSQFVPGCASAGG